MSTEPRHSHARPDVPHPGAAPEDAPAPTGAAAPPPPTPAGQAGEGSSPASSQAKGAAGTAGTGGRPGASSSAAAGELDIQALLAILPHRYPFLLVDRVLSLEPGRRAVGIKCVSANEPYFQGHFPGRPIMPGVLILEAMAQVGAVAVLAVPENRGKLALFAGADRVRWRRPVIPGDCLEIQVEIIAARGAVGKGRARAAVGGETAAEAELTFALRPA